MDQQRVGGVRFDAAAFTNLSQDHLDFHGSMEDYFAAKATSVHARRRARRASVNVDDPWGRRLLDDAAVAAVERSRIDSDADLRALDVEVDAVGICASGSTSHRVALPAARRVQRLELPGRDGRWPARSGIDDRRHRRRHRRRRARCPAASEPIDAGQEFLVVVDYAHTPDSIQRVLRAARPLATGRLIVVFGCGGDRDRAKRPPMGRAATAEADLTVITSDNPRSEDPLAIIAADRDRARARAVGEFVIEADRRLAIGAALREARAGDVVVIAGKGHEPYPGDRRRARRVRRSRGRARGARGATGGGREAQDARATWRERRRAASSGADAEVTPVVTDSRRPAPGACSWRCPAAHRRTGTFVAEAFAARRGGRARARRRRRAGSVGRRRDRPGEALLRLAADERRRFDGTGGRGHRRERQDVDEGHGGGGRSAPRAAPTRARARSTTRSGCR